MNATENEHEWFSHQLATYLAGGLSDAAERARFEAHAASCGRCAADLQHAQQLEGKMSELFAFGIPDSDFEQRIANRLRFRLDQRQWVNPKVRKAAIAAAAVLMFGAAGYVAQNFATDGKLPSLAFFDVKSSASSGSAKALAIAEAQAVRAEQRAMAATQSTPAQRAVADIRADLTKVRQELVSPESVAPGAAANHGILAPYAPAQQSATNSNLNFLETSGSRILGGSNAAGSADFPITFFTGTKNGWGADSISTTSGTVSSPFRSAFSLKDRGNGVVETYVAGAGTSFFQNDTVTFDNAGQQRVVRVQNGGTFRLGTPDGVAQNVGSITTAARDLLRTTGTIDISNASDADGDGISDKARFDVFKSAPGVASAGNGGQVLGEIRHGAGTQSPGALTTSGAETLTIAGTFNMGGQNRQILTANGTGVFSGPLTGGTLVKTGPGYVVLNDNKSGNNGTLLSSSGTIQTGLAATSTSGDGHVELKAPSVTSSQDWKKDSKTSDHFYQGEAVRFADVGAGTVAVNNANTFSGNTTFSSNTPAYAFQGAGKITGDTTLRKTGSGTLIIKSENDYTGGTIAVASNSPANGGSGYVNGAYNHNSGSSLQRLAQGAVIDGKLSIGNVATLTSGGTSNAAAERQLDIRGSNSYGVNVGTLAGTAGTIEGESRVTNSTITLAGGGVALRADGTANLGAPKVNVGNGNVVLSLDGKDPLSNFITSSGTGNLIVNSPTSQVQFNNASSNYSRLTVQAGTVQLNASNQSPKDGTLTVSGSGAFDMSGQGTNTSNGPVTNGTGIAMNKSGAGTQLLAGAGNYTGGARLNQGTVELKSNTSAGAGSIQSFKGARANDLVVLNGDVDLKPDAKSGVLFDNPKSVASSINIASGTASGTSRGNDNSNIQPGDVEALPEGRLRLNNAGIMPGSGTIGSLATDGGVANPARIVADASTLTVNGNLFSENGNLRSGNGALLSSSGTIQSPGANTPKTISIDGPFSINGTSPIESKSETRAFKPADAFALNQPAKPLSIGNIQAGPDRAQSALPSLQTAGQDHSTGLTVVGNLTTSVPPQVAERLGRGAIVDQDAVLLPNDALPEPNAVKGQSQGSLATRDQLAQAVSQPVGGPAGDANSGRAVVAQAQANAAAARRVIREGTMEFEVDSFDSTFNQIATIVGEEGGFIAAADSDKLPNGKVRGMVTVRVPPDRLDLLVLKLRALGELKSQKLGSRDVGKEYTDIESELRAARAMEARLLEMIAKAQGKVAELLEAEKELATWRTKIEKMTGTLNYYNNLISMATLNLQLYEKDIRTPASANITEEISTGVETEDVEVARNAALKAIDEAKGRIIESNLQKLEAGQFAAKIIAEVAPENAGPIIDRLKQLGRLARYDVQKKQTNEGAKNAAGAQSQAPVRLETIPTRIVISLYNLANVAPRLTNNLNIAGDDVEAVYRAILKRVNDVGGRVVSSNLNRQDRAQVSGTMQFEIKSADADAVLNDVRLQGIVLRMVVNENPDTANVTTAKQAFVLSIIPTAQLSSKHFTNMNLAAEDVEAAYGAILKRINASAGSRVISSNLNRQDAAQINGTVQFELKSDDADAVINDLRLQGLVLRMNVGENADGVNVTTVKRSYTMQIVPMATLSPKLTTNLNLAAADVEGMYNSILKIVSASGGSRVLSSNLSRQDATQAVGSLQFEVKSDEAPAVLNEIRKNVQVLQLNLLENPDNANVTTAKQAFVVQIIPTSQVQPREVRELGIQTSEVESAVQIVTAAVANVGGRMIDSRLSQDKNGTTVAQLAIEVPLDKTEQIADMIRKQGTVRSTDLKRNTQIPDGPLSRARLNVTLATGETIVPSEGGFGNSIREGLSTSVKGLLWSLQLIVIGVCLVAPWLLLMWGGWRFLKKRKRATPGV